MTDLQAHPVPCERCAGKPTRTWTGAEFVPDDCPDCDGGRKQTFLFSRPCPAGCRHGLKVLPNGEIEYDRETNEQTRCSACTDQPSAIPPGRVAVTTEGTPDFVGDEHAVTMGYVSVTMTDEDAREVAIAGLDVEPRQPLVGSPLEWVASEQQRFDVYTRLAAAHMLKG